MPPPAHMAMQWRRRPRCGPVGRRRRRPANPWAPARSASGRQRRSPRRSREPPCGKRAWDVFSSAVLRTNRDGARHRRLSPPPARTASGCMRCPATPRPHPHPVAAPGHHLPPRPAGLHRHPRRRRRRHPGTGRGARVDRPGRRVGGRHPAHPGPGHRARPHPRAIRQSPPRVFSILHLPWRDRNAVVEIAPDAIEGSAPRARIGKVPIPLARREDRHGRKRPGAPEPASSRCPQAERRRPGPAPAVSETTGAGRRTARTASS